MKGWSVCAEAEKGQDAVQKALDPNPDVVLLDVSMPNLNCFEAAEIIKTKPPSTVRPLSQQLCKLYSPSFWMLSALAASKIFSRCRKMLTHTFPS
jgi:CheY-like chemotaxis protein